MFGISAATGQAEVAEWTPDGGGTKSSTRQWKTIKEIKSHTIDFEWKRFRMVQVGVLSGVLQQLTVAFMAEWDVLGLHDTRVEHVPVPLQAI